MAAPETLDGVELFEGLDYAAVAAVAADLHEQSFPAGVDVITEQMPGDVAYVVSLGSVKIHARQPDGTEVILAVLGRGDVVGEMSLVDRLGRSASVTTLEESVMFWMDREKFGDHLDRFPSMNRNLVNLLSRRLRTADARIEALAGLDVPGRVARVLLSLGIEYGEQSGDELRIPMPLTQRDLGALVGASRVRVNQVIGAFRRRGLLSVEDHRVTIHDWRALAKRAR